MTMPLVALLLFLPSAALAQQADEVAEEVAFRGYFVEEGLDIPLNDMERLVDDYPGIGFVALDADPAGGADLFADGVLAAIEDPDTVIVLSETEVGVVTDGVYSDDEIESALDEAFADTGDPYVEDFEELAAALTGSTAPGAGSGGSPGSDTGSGGIPWWVWLLGLVAVLSFLSWRSRSKRASSSEMALEAAREEIRQQMAVVANEILEFSDRPDQDRDPDAVEHYRRASETFKAAEDRLASAVTGADLESLSDDLDVARWEMAAAMAIIEGRPIPEKPADEKPQPCFFDPTHGAGTEAAQLRTAAGERTVMVCSADAERLRRGERPEPRSIDVGGRRVPAAQAPRSSGGGGMDWLDAFQIAVGGMAGGADYHWGGGRRRPRGGLGGVLGGAVAGGAVARRRRSSSSRSRASSSSRSSSRRSASRSSRSTSRGRRSR